MREPRAGLRPHGDLLFFQEPPGLQDIERAADKATLYHTQKSKGFRAKHLLDGLGLNKIRRLNPDRAGFSLCKPEFYIPLPAGGITTTSRSLVSRSRQAAKMRHGTGTFLSIYAGFIPHLYYMPIAWNSQQKRIKVYKTK